MCSTFFSLNEHFSYSSGENAGQLAARLAVLSVNDLKSSLDSLSVDYSTFVDKQELVNKLLSDKQVFVVPAVP